MDNNVVCYARISEEEYIEGNSVMHQLMEMKEYCKKSGLNIVQYITDEGKACESMAELDGLSNAISYIVEGRARGIVVWKMSRLSRGMRNLCEIRQIVEDNNGYIISVNELIDTRCNKAGEMFLYLQALLAQMESENSILESQNGGGI